MILSLFDIHKLIPKFCNKGYVRNFNGFHTFYNLWNDHPNIEIWNCSSNLSLVNFKGITSSYKWILKFLLRGIVWK